MEMHFVEFGLSVFLFLIYRSYIDYELSGYNSDCNMYRVIKEILSSPCIRLVIVRF